MSTKYRVPILDEFAWQETVESRASTPPVSPSRGDRYLIIPTGTGAWSGHDNEIAYCCNATGPVWDFASPSEGWVSYIKDQDAWYFYTGTLWKKLLQKNTGAMDEMFVEVMG
jgi:hypothetical protein